MLTGFVLWSSEDVERWRRAGYREGRRVADIVRDAAARWPGKVAVIEGARQLTYGDCRASSCWTMHCRANNRCGC